MLYYFNNYFFKFWNLVIFKKVIFSLLIIIISITFIVSNQSYKVRYYDQLKVFFSLMGLDKYLKSSEYGAHYKYGLQNVSSKIKYFCW